MRKFLTGLLLTGVFVIFANLACAYYEFDPPAVFDELQPLPQQFGMGVNYTKGVVICTQRDVNGIVQKTCAHSYWTDSMSVQYFTYNPTTQAIRFTTNYADYPWFQNWELGLAPTLSAVQGFNTANWTELPALNWADACASIKTSDSSIIMTNTLTSETCSGPISSQLTVTLNPPAGGSVSGANINCNAALGILSDCTETYSAPQSVTLTADTNSGYEFLYWDDGCMQSNENPHAFTIDGSKNVTAKFVQVMSVNVTVDSSMGSVTSSEAPTPFIYCNDQTGSVCSATYHFNDPLTLTASPKPGYKFVRWEDGGQPISSDLVFAFNVQEAKCLTAVFEPFTMKLPLQGGKNWVLSVEAGGNRQCNLSPDSYHTGSGYYALDFVDRNQEDGDLSSLDVPILAAAAGTVVFAGGDPNDNSWGYTVVIDHSSGYKTRYAHLKYAPTVSGTVVQGQQVGVMGNTGNSFGTHLHFQTYYGDSSSSTNTAIQIIYLDGLKLDDYKVSTSTDCNAAIYLSTNQQ